MTILALSATLGLRRTGRLRVALLLGAVPAFLPAPVLACLVCITLPERTIADRVIEAETVVLAREDPARPFSYAPVEPLKGDVSADPIPFLVDSTMRRRLAADRDAITWMGQQYRYMPTPAVMLEQLATGVCGTTRMVSIREHRYPFLQKVGNWNRFSENTGGTLTTRDPTDGHPVFVEVGYEYEADSSLDGGTKKTVSELGTREVQEQHVLGRGSAFGISTLNKWPFRCTFRKALAVSISWQRTR